MNAWIAGEVESRRKHSWAHSELYLSIWTCSGPGSGDSGHSSVLSQLSPETQDLSGISESLFQFSYSHFWILEILSTCACVHVCCVKIPRIFLEI